MKQIAAALEQARHSKWGKRRAVGCRAGHRRGRCLDTASRVVDILCAARAAILDQAHIIYHLFHPANIHALFSQYRAACRHGTQDGAHGWLQLGTCRTWSKRASR